MSEEIIQKNLKSAWIDRKKLSSLNLDQLNELKYKMANEIIVTYCKADKILTVIICSSNHPIQQLKVVNLEYDRKPVKANPLTSAEKITNGFLIEFPMDSIDIHVFDAKLFLDIQYTAKYVSDRPPGSTMTLKFSYDVYLPTMIYKTKKFSYPQYPFYWPSEEMTQLYKVGFKEDQIGSYGCQLLLQRMQSFLKMDQETRDQLSYTQRMDMFKLSLEIEDLENSFRFKKEFPDRKITIRNNQINSYIADWNSEWPFPPMARGTLMCLIKSSNYNENYNMEKFRIFVFFEELTKNNELILTNTKGRILCDLEYYVEFIPIRTSYRASHDSIAKIQRSGETSFLQKFDKEEFLYQIPDSVDDFIIEDTDWCNRNILTNQEQKSAIERILNCASYPCPYVVFGPPGTGKTSTLVEAVIQILKKKPNDKILITAQSNSACDEIGVRLLKFLPKSKIFRFYSLSVFPKIQEIDKDLLKTSNLRNRKDNPVYYEEFETFNVVISTLVNCKQLEQSTVPSNYFKYIFIDECAAAIETEVLIPITLFRLNVTGAQIVIFGDHKQLGPVLSSKETEKMGFGESFMERLMKQENYLRNPEFNPEYVTQLLDNYRSHEAILSFSNKHFYDSTLRAKAAAKSVNVAYNWRHLPNKKFPLVLHSVLQTCKQEKNGTSWYNFQEINVVKFYIFTLLTQGFKGKRVSPADIGIVSPYKSQINKLSREFMHIKELEIGTTEYYQGREKDIMIISTVKSKTSVGFLKNEKRLNVALTRAKYLMIVVCNPETLQQDHDWYNFVKYCYENNAYCGDNFKFVETPTTSQASESESDKELESKFNLIQL